MHAGQNLSAKYFCSRHKNNNNNSNNNNNHRNNNKNNNGNEIIIQTKFAPVTEEV